MSDASRDGNVHKSEGRTLTFKVHFGLGRKGRKILRPDAGPVAAARKELVPHDLARLLALAHRFDALLRVGKIGGLSGLARIASVSRSRIRQVFELLFCPSVQVSILDGTYGTSVSATASEKDLRKIAASPVWETQIALWRQHCESFAEASRWS
jgi:hypothetical protein